MLYDLIIIGAGTAGMTASIYASRYKIKHLIFGELPGGQGTTAHLVENYPGFKSISGPGLMQRFVEQVESYGVKIRAERVVNIKYQIAKSKNTPNQKHSFGSGQANQKSKIFRMRTATGEEYKTHSLILAMGAGHRVLNVPGEEKFAGRGVSYCTTCDLPLFRDKVVAVVGGGDSAVTGAIHAADLCSKVYLIHRRGEFRAEPLWLERLKEKKNVEIILNGVVKEVFGEGKVEGIKIEERKNHKTIERNLKINGLFIEIGQIPASLLSGELGVKLSKQRYILVDAKYQTNVPGVFAAGDLTYLPGSIPFRQFITSAAEGGRAAAAVYEYLNKSRPAPNWGEV